MCSSTSNALRAARCCGVSLLAGFRSGRGCRRNTHALFLGVEASHAVSNEVFLQQQLDTAVELIPQRQSGSFQPRPLWMTGLLRPIELLSGMNRDGMVCSFCDTGMMAHAKTWYPDNLSGSVNENPG